LDIEDLVHEVFVVIARRFKEFRGEAQVTTWLFRVTQNVVRNRRRREHRWLR
jgi:RNA polymerase sigma-70 factor (ECF subfamily)